MAIISASTFSFFADIQSSRRIVIPVDVFKEAGLDIHDHCKVVIQKIK